MNFPRALWVIPPCLEAWQQWPMMDTAAFTTWKTSSKYISKVIFLALSVLLKYYADDPKLLLNHFYSSRPSCTEKQLSTEVVLIKRCLYLVYYTSGAWSDLISNFTYTEKIFVFTSNIFIFLKETDSAAVNWWKSITF